MHCGDVFAVETLKSAVATLEIDFFDLIQGHDDPRKDQVAAVFGFLAAVAVTLSVSVTLFAEMI